MIRTFYTNGNEAKAAFDALQNRKDVTFCDFGSATENGVKGWLVRYEADETFANRPTLVHNGRQLIVILANGDTAKRTTANLYRAAVVGYDKAGKLRILSAHFAHGLALETVAKFNAGQFVNFNYRDKLVGAPIVVTA